MRALVLLCINQHMKFEVHSSTNSKDTIGAKFKKRNTWPCPRPSSAIPEIRLVPPKFQWFT